MMDEKVFFLGDVCAREYLIDDVGDVSKTTMGFMCSAEVVGRTATIGDEMIGVVRPFFAGVSSIGDDSGAV